MNMSDFAVRLMRTESVSDHPDADCSGLSVVKIAGVSVISSKVDGAPRYKQGELVAYIPEAAILPEWLLKRLDFWDDAKNKGTLAGGKGNRLKARNFKGVLSEGMMIQLEDDGTLLVDGVSHTVTEGQDVTDLVGVTKWTP